MQEAPGQASWIAALLNLASAGQGQVGEDNWFAIDKLQHLVACAAISGIFYLICKRNPAYARYRFHIAFLSGVLAGAAKEFGDALKVCD